MTSEDSRAALPSRRRFLGQAGATSVGLGAALLSGCADKTAQAAQAAQSTAAASPGGCEPASASAVLPFYGEHQAGIVTAAQKFIYFLVLDLHSTDLDEIRDVFRRWTTFAALLTQGKNSQPYSSNGYIPPTDTGEADSLGAHRLTLTFGVSPAFLRKLGLDKQAPPEFTDLPLFPRDQLRAELSGGDICIQSCADDPQVAFHAVRQLVRHARSSVTMRWSQAGFSSSDRASDTPRNLFAFKDGTANAETLQQADRHIWVQTPGWLQGGSYLVARKIVMHLETWDRTSARGQDDTFGRHRSSGAPLGGKNENDALDLTAKDAKGQPLIPADSHVALAHRTGVKMLRRSYSYASGIDPLTGQFDAGLMFVSFQQSPQQFIAIQSALGRVDAMNEYITHIGSGLFACFGGVQDGRYLGQSLLEKQHG
ncbi:iron uptake transporter deferrochelatase/peroxidase subunit [Amphibiibacter pelophylacis]|uniref:Iron uptake transporter deferrochelatase/peroxidase subunit n=1 Tax=Amphibiibacter pelophylacis TaxID=1799477 RepID=A0ACC6NYQ0_9BURK